MTFFTPFRIFQDPLEAEELIEVLQKHDIPFERSYEKIADSEDYVGSNPFDTNIVIKIKDKNFHRVEMILKENPIN